MVTDNSIRSKTPPLPIAWHLFGAIALALIPSYKLESVLWLLPRPKMIAIAAIVASYLVCVGLFTWLKNSTGRITPIQIIAVLAVGFTPTLLYLVFTKSEFSRAVLIVELGLSAFMLLVGFAGRGLTAVRALILVIAAAAGIAVQAGYLTGRLPRPPKPEIVLDRVDSALYELDVIHYDHFVKRPANKGGGLAALGSKYVLETGDGDLFLVNFSDDRKKIDMEKMPYHVPMNSADFNKAGEGIANTSWFRAADVLVQQLPDKVRLFASHHFWKVNEKCFVVRVSMLEGRMEDLVGKNPVMNWQTVFESTPCVPLEYPGRPSFFGGIQIGGRLAVMGENQILVTVGDNGLDGWNVPTSMPQDPNTSYGKTVLIDLAGHSSKLYTLGHRNPQGLAVDESGTAWETEHGPQGGDELNKLELGSNYGSPIVTYGVEYGTHAWPFDPVPGEHEGYTRPYYSWVPSIGISDLVVDNGKLFPLWHGDFLVSSLTARKLFRVRIRDQRVQMIETIQMGERIRDIEQSATGELLLWTDNASLMLIRPAADEKTGDAMFDRCTGCHSIKDGRTHGFGPDLFGVVGRKTGSAPGFQYSAAMQKLGGEWTPERLNKFLENPQAMVPGTSMMFPGITDATSREQIIAFLAKNQPRDLTTTAIPD